MANIISIDQDASNNYLPEPDENGKPRINPTYYKNTINDLIIRYIEDSQTNPHKPTLNIDKLTNNNMLAISIYIYETLFKNYNQRYKTDAASIIPYTEYNISTLLQIYIDIVTSYGCIPSLYGFSRLSGIDENTIQKMVTPSSIEILNIRREMLRNRLSDDRMGGIVLANNDTSYGLLYTRQNAIESQAIKTGLSLSDLIPIEKKP